MSRVQAVLLYAGLPKVPEDISEQQDIGAVEEVVVISNDLAVESLLDPLSLGVVRLVTVFVG